MTRREIIAENDGRKRDTEYICLKVIIVRWITPRKIRVGNSLESRRQVCVRYCQYTCRRENWFRMHVDAPTGYPESSFCFDLKDLKYREPILRWRGYERDDVTLRISMFSYNNGKRDIRSSLHELLTSTAVTGGWVLSNPTILCLTYFSAMRSFISVIHHNREHHRIAVRQSRSKLYSHEKEKTVIF
jgi:hypothetical protein